MTPRLVVGLCVLTAACGPSSGYRDGWLTLVTHSDTQRDGFDLSTHQITTDWRAADLYVYVRTTTSLASEQGRILCEKTEGVSSAQEVVTTTSDCLWAASITGPRALLARDRTGGLHRILVDDAFGPSRSQPESGYLVMQVAKVE